MVRLQFSSIFVTIILYFLVIKVNSKERTELLVWEEDHFIKELSQEDIPEDCIKIGICSDITIYDTDFFNELLKRVMKNFTKFNVDEVMVPQKNFMKFNVDEVMVPHLSNLREIEELCESKEEIIWPQAAMDEEGQWQYILNTDSIPFQAYRIQRCIESGSSCSKAAFFEGYDNSCYQEISLRKMVYIDVKNKKLATNYFQVPNCCSCKVIKKLNVD